MEKPYTRFEDIPPYTKAGNYTIDVPLTGIERSLGDIAEGHGIDFDPDFQRGHVWSDAQRTRYIEFLLRGGRSSREILFNQRGWRSLSKEAKEPVLLVDGKQRLTAVRMFIANEVKAFGSFYSEFEDKLGAISYTLRFTVNNLPDRASVLQWYLDLNSGGVVHSDAEIDAVRALLRIEQEKAAASA